MQTPIYREISMAWDDSVELNISFNWLANIFCESQKIA